MKEINVVRVCVCVCVCVDGLLLFICLYTMLFLRKKEVKKMMRTECNSKERRRERLTGKCAISVAEDRFFYINNYVCVLCLLLFSFVPYFILSSILTRFPSIVQGFSLRCCFRCISFRHYFFSSLFPFICSTNTD